MKIVFLTSDQPNQRALAHKLAAVCDLSAIVLSANVPKKQKPRRERARILLNRLEGRVLARPFITAWSGMHARYERAYPRWPLDTQVRVANVNDPDTIQTIETHAPDFVFVSGTNLVGSAVVKAAARKGGILNLHTGISPYVKGGPNCTNWCLAEGLFHLIGNTVMWLDLGIDTGQIIATERTPLDGTETLEALHWNVMEHAHDLYVRVARQLAARTNLPRVAQDAIAPGRTFYAREWSARAMLKARMNFRRWSPTLLQGQALQEEAKRLKLFPVHE